MIDGEIAGLARELVRKQTQSGTEHKEETAYRSLCEGLPVLLRTAGLARTVTFLDAKKNSGAEYAAMLEHMEKQLRELARDRSMNLSEWVASKECKASEYQHLSTLAFRIAYWHKRLAQALLRKKDDK